MKFLCKKGLLMAARNIGFLAFFAAFCITARAQEIVDKTVATVSDSVRTELITYSDVIWQLALQPNTPLNPPRSEDLNQALQTLINQRLFALEAERLPRTAPTVKEINDKINETLSYFPTSAAFEGRLKTVGFASIKDENFQRIIAQRVAIDKYIEFRFASFIVITPDDEAVYYRDTYTKEFRLSTPGVVIPILDEKRPEINRILTQKKVAAGIENFLDEAKRRAVIEILTEI